MLWSYKWMLKLSLLSFAFQLPRRTSAEEDPFYAKVYGNLENSGVVIELIQPNTSHVERLSSLFGLEFIGQVFIGKPWYHLKSTNLFTTSQIDALKLDEYVINVEIQKYKIRERRSHEFWSTRRKQDLFEELFKQAIQKIDPRKRFLENKMKRHRKKNHRSNCAQRRRFAQSHRASNLLSRQSPRDDWLSVKSRLKFLRARLRRTIRPKRGVPVDPESSRETLMGQDSYNDPLFPKQWYLLNKGGQEGQSRYDLNLTSLWAEGITGKGVVLSVVDDGIQFSNMEIADNFADGISYSLIADTADVSPVTDPVTLKNSHGTYCAGIAAAVANNRRCGVGVAHGAKVGGVRIIDNVVTDLQESQAFSRHLEEVDVFSAAWGPTDDGAHLEGPGKLTSIAFEEGIAKGREGKGVIYVWASGNGGAFSDNCNLDGYASSIYTLSVSALTDTGNSVFYSEQCASTFAGIFLGGSHKIEDSILTDSEHNNQKSQDGHSGVVVPELNGRCRNNFQGTSVAAPLMAGIVAMVLQANPSLSWRDVQHLAVESAEPTEDALQEEGWEMTAAGKWFHLKQGFGAINAGKMVHLAKNWKNVGSQKSLKTQMLSDKYSSIYPKSWTNLSHVIHWDPTPETERISKMEHCLVTISLNHPKRGELEIFVASPAGKTSQVLTSRPKDKSGQGFTGWDFMSLQFWGENPTGRWGVAILNNDNSMGLLKQVDITIYGA